MLNIFEYYLWVDHLCAYIGLTHCQYTRLQRDPRFTLLSSVVQREVLTVREHGVHANMVRSYHVFQLSPAGKVAVSSGLPGVAAPITDSAQPLPVSGGGPASSVNSST